MLEKIVGVDVLVISYVSIQFHYSIDQYILLNLKVVANKYTGLIASLQLVLIFFFFLCINLKI